MLPSPSPPLHYGLGEPRLDPLNYFANLDLMVKATIKCRQFRTSPNLESVSCHCCYTLYRPRILKIYQCSHRPQIPCLPHRSSPRLFKSSYLSSQFAPSTRPLAMHLFQNP